MPIAVLGGERFPPAQPLRDPRLRSPQRRFVARPIFSAGEQNASAGTEKTTHSGKLLDLVLNVFLKTFRRFCSCFCSTIEAPTSGLPTPVSSMSSGAASQENASRMRCAVLTVRTFPRSKYTQAPVDMEGECQGRWAGMRHLTTAFMRSCHKVYILEYPPPQPHPSRKAIKNEKQGILWLNPRSGESHRTLAFPKIPRYLHSQKPNPSHTSAPML